MFSNLEESTAYTVRVQGGNTAGWGAVGTASCTTATSVLPAPTGLACSATPTSISFSWNSVAGADSYMAKIQLAVAGSPQTSKSATSTSVVFDSLEPATRYWVGVHAVKSSTPQLSAGVYCTTLADIAAPVVSCMVTSTTIMAFWTAITGATKYRAKRGSGSWTSDLTETSHVFSGLSPGTAYTITVQSGSTAGWGRAGTATCVTIAAGLSCGTATISSVVLNWEARPGVRWWYAARSVPGDFTDGRMLDGELSTRFTGLSKDTSYVLRLWWWGSSRWNEVTPSPVCKTTPVAAPVLTAHTTEGNTLTIEWNPVDGAEVYQMRYRPSQSAGASGASGTNDWRTVVSTGEFHTVTGLSPGTEYTVEIRAGIGSPRRWSAVPSFSLTMSPTTCAASTTTSVTISWDDTADQYHWQTRRITGINQYTDTKTFTKGGATEATYTGLQPGTKYWFGVWRRTETTDQWQPYTRFPHCHTSPSNPVIDQCPQTADSSGTVRWTPNGASSYRITSQGTATNPNWITTNANSYTFTGLAEGTTYAVQLQAWNPSGWSTGSTCQLTTLPAIPTGTLTTTSGTKYYFTKGTVKGVLYAAGKAINDRSTSTSTVTQITCGNGGSMAINQLAAIMLSIPIYEIESPTNANAATSPMVLSRWDNPSQQEQTHARMTESLNKRLYSHMDTAGYLRAHWSPGVGLWQLDQLNNTVLNMNHAERANTTKGGVEVAKWLLNGYCRNTAGDAGLKTALRRWVACYEETSTTHRCYNAYNSGPLKLYENGKLNIGVAQTHGDIDGGVKERTCRWISNEEEMPCFLYDADAPQGKIKGEDKTGQNSARTPLAKAFVSLTDPETGTRYAAWPKQWPRSSAYVDWPTDVVATDKTIYRAVKQNEEVRCSPGRDSTPETVNDCAEGTYKPFGDAIANEDFSGGNRIVEGWYDDSVPFRNGGTAADRRNLQVQTCEARVIAGQSVVYCRWVDV